MIQRTWIFSRDQKHAIKKIERVKKENGRELNKGDGEKRKQTEGKIEEKGGEEN